MIGNFDRTAYLIEVSANGERAASNYYGSTIIYLKESVMKDQMFDVHVFVGNNDGKDGGDRYSQWGQISKCH